MTSERMTDEQLAVLIERVLTPTLLRSTDSWYECIHDICRALEAERAEVKRLERQWAERKCPHDRLNEDGMCRRCGADCRGIW